jgi:phospholipid transport system transporter-binding protein
MVNAELRMISASSASLSGDLLNSTAVGVIEPGKHLLSKAGSEWTVDMSGVGRVSSVGVALILEWLRAANAQNIELKIKNLPQHMRPIIDISDLQPVIEPLLD